MRAAWRFVLESLSCLSSSPERPNGVGTQATGDAPKISVRVRYRGRPPLNPEALVDLYDACKEFIRRCDCGEVRSKRSYAQMKAAVKKADMARR
jgi:hypothetical protein